MAQALKAKLCYGSEDVTGRIHLVRNEDDTAYLWIGHKGMSGACVALVHEKQTELLYRQLHKIYGKEEPK